MARLILILLGLLLCVLVKPIGIIVLLTALVVAGMVTNLMFGFVFVVSCIWESNSFNPRKW